MPSHPVNNARQSPLTWWLQLGHWTSWWDHGYHLGQSVSGVLCAQCCQIGSRFYWSMCGTLFPLLLPCFDKIDWQLCKGPWRMQCRWLVWKWSEPFCSACDWLTFHCLGSEFKNHHIHYCVSGWCTGTVSSAWNLHGDGRKHMNNASGCDESWLGRFMVLVFRGSNSIITRVVCGYFPCIKQKQAFKSSHQQACC